MLFFAFAGTIFFHSFISLSSFTGTGFTWAKDDRMLLPCVGMASNTWPYKPVNKE